MNEAIDNSLEVLTVSGFLRSNFGVLGLLLYPPPNP